MIVVVVLAVLATIAIPNLRSIIKKSQIRDASGAITSSLMLARSEAIAQGREIVVCFTSSTTCTSGSSAWQDGWLVIEESTPTVLRTVGDLDNEVVITPEASVGRVAYQADGSVRFRTQAGALITPTTNKTFTFANTCWSSAITVSAIGRVFVTSTGITFSGC